MYDDVKQHIEDALDEIRAIFMMAVDKIEALKVGDKIAGTTLAADIAAVITDKTIADAIANHKLPAGTTANDDKLVKDFKVSGPTLYPTLKYLYTDYPYTSLKRGAMGGITKLARPDNTAPVTAPVTQEDDNVVDTAIKAVEHPSKISKDDFIKTMVDFGKKILDQSKEGSDK
jgi:hypothetical protein